jgi:hypothetical protein
LANIPKVVYNLDIINGQSIFDAAAAFAAAHRGEANVVGRFYLSASYIPSDLPATTNAEKYGYGEIDIRVSPNSGSNFDGKIFLYGFNSNLLYVKDISNGTAGSWKQLSTDIYAFEEKQESNGISIAACANGTQNITVTKSGYTPVMAMLISPWQEHLALGGITITDANTIACMLINTSSSAVTARPRIKVMYVKS